MDATIVSIPVSGENVVFTQTFTYIGRVIHSSTESEADVNRRAFSAMDALDVGVWRCQHLCKTQKSNFSSAGPPGLVRRGL